MRKMLTMAALVVAVSAGHVHAGEADAKAEVRKIAQTLGDQTVAAIKVEDKADRWRLLQEAAAPAIDFRAIAQGVLNYAGAKVPSNREAEVVDQVVVFMTHAIVSQIERVRPETATIDDVTVKNENEIRVAMSLDGVQDSIDGQWHFKKSGDAWKVTEIAVTGGTLTGHFGEKLARHARGVDQLVDYLRDQQRRSQTAQVR